jgi:hypothetical protein
VFEHSADAFCVVGVPSTSKHVQRLPAVQFEVAGMMMWQFPGV